MNSDQIKALRVRLGWTQERLARELDVSFATVNRWERGHRAPSPLAAHALAKVLTKTERVS